MLFNDQKRESLKKLLKKGPVLVPNIFDCVSAKVMEQVGFEAFNLPCANVAASLIGMPDLGMLDFDEMLTVVDHIYNMSGKPIIADINCGFGNEINVLRSCERMLKAGASALILDDKKFQPAFGAENVIVERDEFLAKIRAARYVLEGTDCLLIARTSAFGKLGLNEAVERCKMVREAGAEVTFIEGIKKKDDLKQVANEVDGWKMFEMGSEKVATYEELIDMGYHLIAMEFAMAGANEYMMSYGSRSKQDMSDIYAVEHSILPSGEKMTALGNHEMFGANDWLRLGASFNDHSQLKFAGAFLPKEQHIV